jgi:hypothetical protein
MNSQTPGTQQNRDEQKIRPQRGGQHNQENQEDRKPGAGKDPSRGDSMNPGNEPDRSRKPGHKPQP